MCYTSSPRPTTAVGHDDLDEGPGLALEVVQGVKWGSFACICAPDRSGVSGLDSPVL